MLVNIRLEEVQTICALSPILVSAAMARSCLALVALIVAKVIECTFCWVRRECSYRAFWCCQVDRESHIDVARVPENKARRPDCHYCRQRSTWGLGLVPLKALALCCAARRKNRHRCVVARSIVSLPHATGRWCHPAVAFEVGRRPSLPRMLIVATLRPKIRSFRHRRVSTYAPPTSRFCQAMSPSPGRRCKCFCMLGHI